MTRKIFIGLIGWFVIGCAITFCIAQDELVPPPEVRIEKPNAIYGRQFFHLYREFKASPSPALCQKLIVALERLLLEEPSGRFALAPRFLESVAKRIYDLDSSGGPLGTLSELYQYQGRYDEALALEVQKSLVMHEDGLRMVLAGLHVNPDPMRADPPPALILTIEAAKKILAKKPNVHSPIFIHGWCVRVKWKGDNPNDALVSLNDVAYAFDRDPVADVFGAKPLPSGLKRDWQAGRFTLSLKNTTLVFQAGLKKALVDGKEVALRRQVERAPYDLYVPLGDLLKSLGGAVRPPQKDELKDFQKHFPVSLLVVDLK